MGGVFEAVLLGFEHGDDVVSVDINGREEKCHARLFADGAVNLDDLEVAYHSEVVNGWSALAARLPQMLMATESSVFVDCAFSFSPMLMSSGLFELSFGFCLIDMMFSAVLFELDAPVVS